MKPKKEIIKTYYRRQKGKYIGFGLFLSGIVIALIRGRFIEENVFDVKKSKYFDTISDISIVLIGICTLAGLFIAIASSNCAFCDSGVSRRTGACKCKGSSDERDLHINLLEQSISEEEEHERKR